MRSKKQFRVACISTVARACSSCVRIVTQSLWRVGTLEYIRPAKYAVKIPSRLGVGSKKHFRVACISMVARACSSCVRIVTQSLWRVGTLEYIRPVKYAVKIPSRLGVLGKKLNFFSSAVDSSEKKKKREGCLQSFEQT